MVARLVGEPFFRGMARVYVAREPPRSAVLLRYGASFPDFVAGFAPAASVPYLADMASLEWAWHAAYHATDAAPLPVIELAKAVDRAADTVLALHPSLSVVRSAHPIVSIFELNMQGGDVPPARLEGARMRSWRDRASMSSCAGYRRAVLPSSSRSKKGRPLARPPPLLWRGSQASTFRPISPG